MNPLELLTRKFKSRGGLIGKIGQKLTSKHAMLNVHDINKMLVEMTTDAEKHELEALIHVINEITLAIEQTIDQMKKVGEDTSVTCDGIIELDEKMAVFVHKNITDSNFPNKKKLLEEMSSHSKVITEDALKRFKEEYTRLLTLIKTTGTVDHTVEIEKFLDLLKNNNISYVDYYKMRQEYKAETSGLYEAKKSFQYFKNAFSKLQRAQGKFVKHWIDVMHTESKKFYDSLHKGFENSYMAMIREITWLFIIQKKMTDFYRNISDLEEQHEIPIKIADDTESHINSIETKLHKIARNEEFITIKQYKKEGRTYL